MSRDLATSTNELANRGACNTLFYDGVIISAGGELVVTGAAYIGRRY